jgi:antitoxin PrlF
MKVNAKGQITIPKWIREIMGLTPGCEVEFTFENGTVFMSKVEAPDRNAEPIPSLHRSAV